MIIVFRDNDIGKDIFFVINFFQGLSVKAFFDIDFRRGKVFLDFEDGLGSFFRKNGGVEIDRKLGGKTRRRFRGIGGCMAFDITDDLVNLLKFLVDDFSFLGQRNAGFAAL